MNTQSEDIKTNDSNDSLDFKLLFFKLLASWGVVAISLVVCLALSYIYLRYKTPIFKISARVLVNDEKKGAGLTGNSDVLGDLGGLLGEKSTVDNEAEIFKTRFLMEQVVKDLKLNITYFKESRVKSTQIYKSPFQLDLIEPKDSIVSTNVKVKISGNSLLLNSDQLDTTIHFNKVFKLPGVGTVRILKNRDSVDASAIYGFNIMSTDAKVAELMSALTVEVLNKQITIIDLSLNHPIPKMGEDILNKVIEKYVQANLKDKNEVADSTVKFIQNRLSFIGKELGDLEGNIQGFKQKNSLADMTEQSKLLVQSTSQFVSELTKVETQITIIKSLQKYLGDSYTNKRILPSSLVPTDIIFNGAVERFNELTLERAKRLIGVTEANPAIILIDKEIANARLDIESNLFTSLNALNITRDKIKNEIARADSQVQGIPEIERNYLNLARQQQIKQELYIFLMQKSEETAISKTSNISNSKTIDPPKSGVQPVSPKRSLIFAIGLLCGLIIPIIIIYLKELLNNKIQNREDLEKLTNVPIIGEISHNTMSDNLVVSNSSRSAITEQFRALRTNLSFYLNRKKGNVILVTSSMGGEGKSFVAINLGNILAVSDKKVLLMELDLRKPGLSIKVGTDNSVGFSNYIINTELTTDDILKSLAIHENLSIISSGPIPPNPAEMLLNERTSILMAELREKFDYIIIDAPPIGIVTDAQLLSQYADSCIYLVRQNYTYKQQLNIVENLSSTKKMRQLGIVVNDISQEGNGYGYGYGYGYGNGYGYGYGSYGNEEVAKTSFWKKLTGRK